jgi:hypothetical protein
MEGSFQFPIKYLKHKYVALWKEFPVWVYQNKKQRGIKFYEHLR